MQGPLLAIGLGTVLLVAVVTWAVARRYGRVRALVVPILALASVAVLVWRAGGVDAHLAMGMVAVATGLAGASVAGALIGIYLARWRGK